MHGERHYGVNAMVQALLEEEFYCPGLHALCRKVKMECLECARHDKQRRGYHPLRTILATLPRDHSAIDLLELPTDRYGYSYIYVERDIMTGTIWLRALKDKFAETVAHHYLQIAGDFGYVKVMQSDNGKEFVNFLIEAINDILQVEHRKTTPYHPRANGAAESAVKDTLNSILKICGTYIHSFSKLVPFIQLTLNDRNSRTHHSAPFALMFARKANFMINESNNNSNGANMKEIDLVLWEKHIGELATKIWPQVNMTKAQYKQHMKKVFDNEKRLLKNLPIGTTVMTVNTNKKIKTDPKFVGPFTVLHRTTGGSYELTDRLGLKLPRAYAPEQLKVVSVKPFEEPSYEVQEILEEVVEDGTTWFLCKWKGFDDSHNSYVELANFDEIDIINKFRGKNKRNKRNKK